MQNVSRIQKHPDTLIKNFFIAGLSQRTFQQEIFPARGDGKKKRDLFDLEPEILFSLYEQPEKMAAYLGQVFPDKVRILQTEKMVDPKFFSFMSVDALGFNQYNHCLIFYEAFNENLIHEDFDEDAYIERLVRKREQIEFGKQQRQDLAGILKTVDPADSFGKAGDIRRAKQLMTRVNINTNVDINVKDDAELAEDVTRQFEAFVKAPLRQSQQRAPRTISNTLSGSLQVVKDAGKAVVGKRISTGIKEGVNGFTKMIGLGNDNKLESVQEMATEDDNLTQHDSSKSPGMMQEKSANMQNLKLPQARAFPDLVAGREPQTAVPSNQNFTNSRITAGNINKNSFAGSSEQPQNNFGKPTRTSGNTNPRNKGEYFFAPIAFVIQTEVEHHDIFKEIILSLFESIRAPQKMIKDDQQKDRQLAFADFLCHLAFLGSIPCPTFNTRYHIEFFGKTLSLSEPNYDEIPDKNQLAIRVLFDMLDVRTIMYCWKAILFDQTLVLISSQYSLQFYIAQALLQLLFPLTFQYSYVQPASLSRLGMVSSPFPILFACSHLVAHYEYFEEMQKGHVAICDIDGSFTNNIKFPELEDEKRILRNLSALKNFKGAKFDSAFHEMYQEELLESDARFTIEVRNVFFGILEQFLNLLPDGSLFKKLEIGEEKAFINYFDHEGYLDWFDGTKNKEFAEKLMNSQAFATFCDDFFDKNVVSNMLIYVNISQNGFDFQADDNEDPSMKKAFDQRMKQIELDLIANNQKVKNDKATTVIQNTACVRANACDDIKEWPSEQKIDFCWRMPIDNQRIMIFERLEYAIMDYDREREQDKRFSNTYMTQSLTFQEIQLEKKLTQKHNKHMEDLYKLIGNIKQLFIHKLPAYAEQVRQSKKDFSLDGLKNENLVEIPIELTKTSSIDLTQSLASALPPHALRRLQTFQDTQGNEKKVNCSVDGKLATQQNEDKNKNTNFNSMIPQSGDNDKERMSKDCVTIHFDISNQDVISGTDDNTSEMTPLSQIGDNQTQNQQTNDEVDDRFLNVFNQERVKTKSEYVKNRESLNHRDEEQKGVPQKFSNEYMQENGNEMDNVKKVFWEYREQYRAQFFTNRIVEICYGHNGLLDFLDMLFTQFPSKRQVKSKFNYYFAIKSQLTNVEQQIQNELVSTDNQDLSGWFERRKVLLENPSQSFQNALQKSQLARASQKLSPDKLLPENEVDEFPQLLLQPGVSIVFQGGQGQNDICDLSENLSRQTSIKLWDMNDSNYNPLEVKGGELGVFKQNNVKSNAWMLPVLPEKVEIKPETDQYLSSLEKLVAFRTSYQYISLKQKLFFAFEDQEEAIQLILREFLLFSQKDRQIFPTNRFYELLEEMTQPQKNRIFRKIVSQLKDDDNIFQLRLMFEHEVLGMDADVDEAVSLDHKLFDQDFLAVQPKRGPIGMTTQLTQNDLIKRAQDNFNSTQIAQKTQMMKNSQNNKIDLSSRSEVGSQHVKGKGSTDINNSIASSQRQSAAQSVHSKKPGAQESFYVEQKDLVPNPDKQVQKLLEKLINLYKEVFDPTVFDEQSKKIIDKDAIPKIKAKLLKLRNYEYKKLGNVELCFDVALDCEESRQMRETIKRCFWINLFNYKILMKILEVLLTKPKILYEQLTNCTMFECLMCSIKVRVQGHLISCYEIFRTMLKHDALLVGAFEEPVRSIDNMPAEIQELAVNEVHPTSSYGLFLPIKKWSGFTIYVKEKFEDQLREQINSNNYRLHISDSNFLIKIPKFFFWNSYQGTSIDSRVNQQSASQMNQEAVKLLKQVVDERIVDEGETCDQIKSVLSQIQAEQDSASSQTKNVGGLGAADEIGYSTNHLFEIESFWFKFDILFLRSNIREYCARQEEQQMRGSMLMYPKTKQAVHVHLSVLDKTDESQQPQDMRYVEIQEKQ